MNFKLLNTLWVGMAVLAMPITAVAAPHFTLTPATGSETVGQNFTVKLGVDSDTAKVVGIDMKLSYDSAKLEIVSVAKGTVPEDGYQFSYADGQSIIHNDTGVMEVTLTPLNQSVLVGPVAKHELLIVTFKPKAVGTATVNYTCLAGSVVETNIISQEGVDVVECSTNQSGSYTITAGSGGDTGGNDDDTGATATATPVPSSNGSSLPQTGAVENTILLAIFGISSIGAALYLKLI